MPHMPARDRSATPAASWFPRGYALLYHSGETNHCPGCGQRHWIIGRMMAQCARCDTALPLDEVHGVGYAPRFINGRRETDADALFNSPLLEN
ncbi:hypothetical protein [Sphingobium baderi]|nr:hypothetical protein [Sphingobium baderi]TWH90488.1 hypothetical protein IQ35_03424 [Sphingobium wenxiniae]WRD76924.1 hypothetical protein QQ987_01895 [Sphingobium baderi]